MHVQIFADMLKIYNALSLCCIPQTALEHSYKEITKCGFLSLCPVAFY